MSTPKPKQPQDGDDSDGISWDQPVPYEVHSSGDVLASSAAVNSHGGIDIDFSSSRPEELKSLLPPFPSPKQLGQQLPPDADRKCPALNITIQVVGSRGDVQPFIALGTALQRYGHRVRLATHDNFADFVRSSGLEFYPIGGDPEDLMAYMVKNPGLIPSMESLRGGDIGRKRRMMHDMLRGCWQSCVEPDPLSRRPFVADVIIANPPSFAHVHCAEALCVPLHIMFTMPWSATRSFPHPLANVNGDKMDPRTSNYLSYGVVDLMTWQGLGDVINGWRVKDLKLEPLAAAVGPDVVSILKIPHTYCWSPALVPKPADWGETIDICGFFMRDEPAYTPPADLQAFLENGPEPVYIGFGSIVLEDPARVTEVIKEACQRLGVRAIVSRGWSKLGGTDPSTKEVFYLGDCPHEWLFKRVAAVVHHGGAGTTACGLINGRPTTIVPFFGDQPFWAKVVASNGAGPMPLPYAKLSTDALAEAIGFCLSPSAKEAAQKIAAQMRQENGVQTAVQSLHRHLPIDELRCHLLPEFTARWAYLAKSKKAQQPLIRLSDEALSVLIKAKKLKMSDVQPLRCKEYHVENERWDPLTAGASATLGIATDFTSALGGIWVDPFKEVRRVRRDKESGESAGAAAAVAVGKGFAGVTGVVAKGSLVDFPLAMTEGLRNTPKLLGEDVRDHGKVTDAKTGGVVAAKVQPLSTSPKDFLTWRQNFGYGMYDGITGLVTRPMEGAKQGGTMGFLKGVGQGSIGFIAKPGSGKFEAAIEVCKLMTLIAMFGLMAYPAQGVYKSMKGAQKNTVAKAVERGRSEMLSELSKGGSGDFRVVGLFENMVGK
ncbi:hypothetical protein ACHAQF_008401 [Verticillium nonalfalfae]